MPSKYLHFYTGTIHCLDPSRRFIRYRNSLCWCVSLRLSFRQEPYSLSGMALRHFIMRRISFASHLNNSNSALTTSRYLRLMAMASLQMICSIAATSYQLWFTLQTNALRPWKSWNFVHSDWLRIGIFPALFTPEFVAKFFYIAWWFVPLPTFLFVAFFSFGKDAMDEYRKCFEWLRVHVLRQSNNSSNSKRSFLKMSL